MRRGKDKINNKISKTAEFSVEAINFGVAKLINDCSDGILQAHVYSNNSIRLCVNKMLCYVFDATILTGKSGRGTFYPSGIIYFGGSPF